MCFVYLTRYNPPVLYSTYTHTPYLVATMYLVIGPNLKLNIAKTPQDVSQAIHLGAAFVPV